MFFVPQTYSLYLKNHLWQQQNGVTKCIFPVRPIFCSPTESCHFSWLPVCETTRKTFQFIRGRKKNAFFSLISSSQLATAALADFSLGSVKNLNTPPPKIFIFCKLFQLLLLIAYQKERKKEMKLLRKKRQEHANLHSWMCTYTKTLHKHFNYVFIFGNFITIIHS